MQSIHSPNNSYINKSSVTQFSNMQMNSSNMKAQNEQLKESEENKTLYAKMQNTIYP